MRGKQQQGREEIKERGKKRKEYEICSTITDKVQNTVIEALLLELMDCCETGKKIINLYVTLCFLFLSLSEETELLI